MDRKLIAAVLGSTVFTTAGAVDFGREAEVLLRAQTPVLFGVLGSLNASSTTQTTGAAAQADPRHLVTLAPGLTAKVISKADGLGGNIDQMVLWPDDVHPTHLIAC